MNKGLSYCGRMTSADCQNGSIHKYCYNKELRQIMARDKDSRKKDPLPKWQVEQTITSVVYTSTSRGYKIEKNCLIAKSSNSKDL